MRLADRRHPRWWIALWLGAAACEDAAAGPAASNDQHGAAQSASEAGSLTPSEDHAAAGDSGEYDAGAAQASGREGGAPDRGAADEARAGDAGQADAASQPALRDAAQDPDGTSGEHAGAGSCRPFVMPADCPDAPDGALPSELRCTGLYGDWGARELACGVLEYEPAFELWSDGDEKRRFAALPPGTSVDVSDPEAFRYPLGTQFWKEFRIQGPDGQLELEETRLIRKTAGGWLYTTYVWSEGAESARQNDRGVADLRGTGHTVPSHDDCNTCHSGRADFVLGWDWLMLGPGASGATREQLLARGLLTANGAPAELPDAQIPGDQIERAALGYLHANCGISCHNETHATILDGLTERLLMRLELGDLGSVLDTDAARTGINRAPFFLTTALFWGAEPPGGFYNFRPGDLERSYAIARASMRGAPQQMPALATNRVDEQGVRVLSAWIEHMTPELGYPPAAP